MLTGQPNTVFIMDSIIKFGFMYQEPDDSYLKQWAWWIDRTCSGACWVLFVFSSLASFSLASGSSYLNASSPFAWNLLTHFLLFSHKWDNNYFLGVWVKTNSLEHSCLFNSSWHFLSPNSKCLPSVTFNPRGSNAINVQQTNAAWCESEKALFFLLWVEHIYKSWKHFRKEYTRWLTPSFSLHRVWIGRLSKKQALLLS